MKKPETLQQAIIYFSDADRCFDYAVGLRWPGGKVACPRCGSEKHSFIKTRRIWFCYPCKKQFTVKVGTIFEDSPLGMDKWMVAVWMIVNCKNGISSYEIGRALGITQKSAWFMLHRVRLAMQEGDTTIKLGGKGKEVEVDESFIGGKSRFMHADMRRKRNVTMGDKGKVPVLGILERGGKVRAFPIDSRKKKPLQAAVKENVAAASALFTDALPSYEGLIRDYSHQVIDHAVSYVEGRVHTNTLENFWSLVKRQLKGTYISVEPFHLFRYLDEQAFRWNYREDMNDGDRFHEAMKHIAGKRLTYSELTGKDTDSLHQ